MDILHFVYPSSVDRHSGDCAPSCYKHSQKNFCFNTCFQFSWQSKSETSWSHGMTHNTAMRNSVYNFLWNYQTIFTVTIPFYIIISVGGFQFIYNYLNCERRGWHPTLVLLLGKSHGQRSLVGYSSWGCKESDTTERFHFIEQ